MKLVITMLALIFIVLISGCVQTANNDQITIGAVLPLSGPSALWGESVRNGMELALEDHPNVRIIYEDSKGNAADGLTAYNSLLTRNVDVFVSSLSVVSIPLASRSLETNIPLIATQSAADNLTNNYTFRYYTNADKFAMPSFASNISPLRNITNVAILYRNDEYAKSVASKVQQLCAEQGKHVVFIESYLPNEADFSTPMVKIKGSSAQALLFIPTPPSESLGILRKAQELELSIPLVEVSNVLSDPQTRSQAPNMTFYTNQFAFSISGNSEPFKQRYSAKFGRDPNFVAAFGFDIVNLLSNCERDVLKCLKNKKSVTGVTGVAENIENNDIVIPMYLMKVN